MPDPTSFTFVLPAPPPGFSGKLADIFALIQSTLQGSLAVDSTLVGTGSVLPTSNIGPFIYTGVNPPQLYTWDTTQGKYVPAALPPDTTIPKLIVGQDIKYCAGTLAQINALQNPNGWYLADGGTYKGVTTPDLRNLFLVGQGSSYAQGSTGGSDTLANHTHTLPTATDSHTLSTPEIPSHTHSFSETVERGQTGGGNLVGFPSGVANSEVWAVGVQGGTVDSTLVINSTGGGTGHTHGITGPSGNQNTALSIIPPYYAVAILMYCGV